MTGPTAWTAGCRWKCRPCWPTTRPARWPQAKELHARAGRPNLFIKIPGTPEGLPAIEEAIFAGVPINVTLLFSREQYLAAAEAFLRGIERRIAAGLKPDVGSVASLFISRWDAAVAGKVPAALTNQLGIAIARRTYKAYRELLASPRWQRAYNAAPGPSACSGPAPEPRIPRPPTCFTSRRWPRRSRSTRCPEATLKAFADHGEGRRDHAGDGGDCEAVLARFGKAGINIDALAARLQDEGAKSFAKSWNELMGVIASKTEALKEAA